MDLKRAQAFRWFTCLINLRGKLVELGRLQHLEVFLPYSAKSVLTS